jgi:hypothetical protein
VYISETNPYNRMELFLLLVVLVILILVFSNVSGLKHELAKIQNELIDLKNLIRKYQ